MSISIRTAMLLAAAGFAGLAHAAPGVLNTTGQFSTGGVTTGRAMPVVQGNPALLPVMLKPEQSFRMSILEVSVAQEVGPVDDFEDDLERIGDLLDAQYTSQAEAQAALDEINSLLPPIADAAYLRTDVAAPLPLLPMVFRVGPGVASIHVDASASIGATVLDDPVAAFETGTNTPCDNTSTDCEVRTESAVYLRSGMFGRLAIGYGQTLATVPAFGSEGSLNVGGRLSVIKAEMSKQVAKLDDGGQDESAFDRAGDNYDLNKKEGTGVALDGAVSWVGKNLQAGLTLRNLLAPEFDYGAIGVNCAAKPTVTEQDDCNAAAVFVGTGEISSAGSFKMEPQAMLEAGYRVMESNFRILGSYELNKVETVAGSESQLMFVGLNYEGPWWLPGLRAGYQKQLAGAELDAVTGGLTLLGFLNVDVLYGLDEISVDGKNYPRVAGARIGFAVPFK